MVEKKAIRPSCRGSRDLQLWYSSVCLLQFIFLEKNRVKARQFELFWLLALQSARRRRASPRASAGPARRGRPWSAGPRVVDSLAPHRLPSPLPLRHAPRTPWPGRTDRAAARPLELPSYTTARRRRTARPCRDFGVALACANRLPNRCLYKDPSSTRVALPATEPPLCHS
jgi:hypothetical protein